MKLHEATPVPGPFARGQARRDWEGLLCLLLRDGILHESATQPVVSRDGTTARWMLESWPVSLSAEGALLAGRCLLTLLEGFEGTQLATFGLTGIPLLQSCILQSGGRYTGLVIRKEPKGHGSKKLIEGKIRPREPVVLVDDSVSSGLSSWQAAERLAAAGLCLEGGVCLVRFGYKGGFSIMQGRGLRMESVFDVWEHLMRQMPEERLPSTNPSRIRPAARPAEQLAPADLHPAALARHVIAHYLEHGETLLPPATMTPSLETRGGVWVSLRSRRHVHRRYARDGFWRFPDDAADDEDGPRRRTSSAQSAARAAADVTFAAVCAATKLKRREHLDDSAIAVTGFGPLQIVAPGQLDNDMYGIVVRSKERTGQMGGALPRMPGIEHHWRQLQHARIKNAGLLPHEPYEVLRHTVHKLVEDGALWQPTGVPRGAEPALSERAEVCAPVAEHARAWCLYVLGRGPPPPPLDEGARTALEPGLDSVYLTVYRGGRLAGCMGCTVTASRKLGQALESLSRAALADPRFAAPSSGDDRVAVSVSLLTHPLVLGHFTAAEVMERVRLGEQALMAVQAADVSSSSIAQESGAQGLGATAPVKAGLLLPFVAAHHDLGRVAFAEDVLTKAGISLRAPEARVSWTRFDCHTWIADGQDVRPLLGAFPVKRTRPSVDEALAKLIELTGRYLIHHQLESGDGYTAYRPLQNRLVHRVDLPRHAHATWVLTRAARRSALLREAAGPRLRWLLAHAHDDERGGRWIGAEKATVAEVVFTALSVLELEAQGASPRPADHPLAALTEPLLSTLWSSIGVHGRFAVHRDPRQERDAYQDYTPGQALLALAAAIEAGATFVDDERAERAAAAWWAVRHRCAYRRHPGQVAFVPQAALAWDRIAGGDDNAACAFGLADWILEHQALEVRAADGRFVGAFYDDHQHDTPGFTSALYVEGVAAAGLLALRRGDRARAARYLAACRRAVPFLSTLLIDDDDACVLPNPALASGGIRPSHLASGVRCDMSAHTLAACLAVVELGEALGEPTSHHRTAP